MTTLRLIVLVSIGLCGVVGLWGLFRPKDALAYIAGGLALLVAGIATIESTAGRGTHLVLLVFACTLAVLLALRVSWFHQAIGHMAASRQFPRLIFAAVVSGGAICLIALLWTGDSSDKATPSANPLDQEELVRLIPVKSPAMTDASRPVAIFRYGESVPADMTEADGKFISMLPGGLLFAGYHGPCNCHGFVFAGGRYWIMNDSVPAILKDNGYQQVSAPAVGDLIVYWDEAHHPIHSGLVRAATKHGPILIESKWGMRGQYFHTPESQVFSKNFGYFRSSRQGHLLRGLEDHLDLAE